MATHLIENEAASTPVEVRIPCGTVTLERVLTIPPGVSGMVVFAHGSGSSRHSPRNQFVARIIRESGNGTLLFDLLTAEEDRGRCNAASAFRYRPVGGSARGSDAVASGATAVRDLGVGYFGSSTGGGAALLAAAEVGRRIDAVVSRGGRPDLAGDALRRVQSSTLFIVGEYDEVVIRLNEEALAELRCEKQLRIVPGATHLFEEPGTLEAVARLAADGFAGICTPSNT
jgi:pimeloyl-ACP methyl ester carboxylesterase